jgi:hypothetical protein
MSQQINLFNPVFLKQKRHFSALAMVQALALTVLGILVLYAYEQRQIRVLEQSATESERQLATRRSQLLGFSKQFSDQGTSKALSAELQAAEARLQERRTLLEDVRTGVGGDVLGYSRYLAALARAATTGVWLTGLDIGGKSGDIVIKARALESALVPVYIRALNKESAFGGRALGELQITAHGAAKPPAARAEGAAEPAQYVEFSLRIPAKGGS